jgi:hypothetical protein
VIRVLALILLLTSTAAAQFGTPRDLAFWGKSQRAFQLADISDLILWIDVSEATNNGIAGPPANGSIVTDFNRDLSPRNNDVLIRAEANNAYYVATGGGYDSNYPYITFTNDNQGGTRAALTNSTSFTIVTVMKPLATADAGPFWADRENTLGNGAAANVKFGSTSVDNLSNDDAYNIMNIADLESDIGSRSTNWQVLLMVANAAASSIWLDGVKIKTGTVGTTYGLTNGVGSGFSGWGGDAYTGANWCSILFARGLVYGRALTDDECDLVNRKCMDDFGFP